MIPTDRDEAALVQRARAMRTGLDARAAEFQRDLSGEEQVIKEAPKEAVPMPPSVIPSAPQR